MPTRYSEEFGRPSAQPSSARRSGRLDTRMIFREMIAQELRAGRLTRSRRARIVRYAAQLGLSAVEAGEMVASCCNEAFDAGDTRQKKLALRLVRPPQPLISTDAKIWMLVGVGIVIDAWLLLRLI